MDGFGELEGVVAGKEFDCFFDLWVVQDLGWDLVEGARGASGCGWRFED
jgi:hypothetical protein